MDSIDRATLVAQYIIEHKTTVRQASKKFGISKSTVHKDVSYRLQNINLALYKEVKKILKHNLAVRHIRGGESTRKKYQKSK